MKMDEKSLTLHLAAGAVSFSAIAYELVLATYATFLLGSTVFQYTLVFSVMMAAMGIGSYLVGTFETKAHRVFILCEIALSCLALISVPLLYWCFSTQIGTQVVLIFLVVAIGVLVGVEVPLLNAVKGSSSTVSKILFSDYLGGFAGGLLFPLLLLPSLGFFRISALLATVNIAIAFQFLRFFKLHLKRDYARLRIVLSVLLIISISYFLGGEFVRRSLESKLFGIGS